MLQSPCLLTGHLPAKYALSLEPYLNNQHLSLLYFDHQPDFSDQLAKLTSRIVPSLASQKFTTPLLPCYIRPAHITKSKKITL
ncbi:MAG TPA: hypothetical protein ENN77_00440 [Candidatus Wirthbacteria bacterium]|nr:hypothetical protein [Candidatus Wirthbacteria bacterium]